MSHRSRVLALGILAALGSGARLRAQDPREAQVNRAFDEFNSSRRIQILVRALDPALGPPRGSWGTGVQLLAQTLLEERKDSLANIWMRWAARLAPDLRVDTVQFLPQVAAMHRAAREFVRQTSTSGDSLVSTTWSWPTRAAPNAPGALSVTAPSLEGALEAWAERVGALTPGVSRTVRPGSYAITAGAEGYDSLTVTREVLPGTTTRLEFRLRPPAPPVAARPENALPPREPEVMGERKKGFPWALVGLGAGVAAVAVLAAGGGDGGGDGNGGPPPTTGGITIVFPNP